MQMENSSWVPHIEKFWNEKLVYIYDANEHLIQVNNYFDNKYIGKFLFIYDDKGNQIEEINSFEYGSLEKIFFINMIIKVT